MVKGIADLPPSSVIDVFCQELCGLKSSSLVRHRGQPGGYPVQPDLHSPAFSLCAWGGSWRDQGLLLPMSHLLWNRSVACGITDQSNALAWSKNTLCCRLPPDQDYFPFNLLLSSEIFLFPCPQEPIIDLHRYSSSWWSLVIWPSSTPSIWWRVDTPPWRPSLCPSI